MQLRISDHSRILSVLDDLIEASDLDGFAALGVAGLHRLAPSRAISFHEIRHAGARARSGSVDVRYYHEEPFVDWGTDLWERASACRDPYPLCADHDGQPTVGRLSDAISRRGLMELDFYREMMHPVEREHEVKLALPTRRGMCRAFLLTRERCDFSDREMEAMRAVQPHLIHAFTDVRTREVADGVVSDDQSESGSERVAVISLGPDDRIEKVTGPALELLAAYVAVNGTRLPDPLDAWMDEQRRRAHDPQIGDPPRPYVVDRGANRLIARFLAGSGAGRVVLEERRSGPSTSASSGLTRRELEVLRLVRDGLTNKEVAQTLSITADTVRKHLENAYAKLEVGTRTAAVAKAFGWPDG